MRASSALDVQIVPITIAKTDISAKVEKREKSSRVGGIKPQNYYFNLHNTRLEEN
jgi:hypothetical protein